jgi:hypothetical protein
VNAFRWTTGVALAALAMAVAAPGYCQFPGGSPAGRGGGSKGGEGMRMGSPERQGKEEANPVQNLVAVVTYRLDLLEEDLRLTPDQRGAWKNYRDRVLGMADDMARATRTLASGEMTAPQRLDRLTDVVRDRLTAMEDVADAGKRLYASLTPVQQQLADRRLAVALMPLAGAEPAAAGGRSQPARGPGEPPRSP